MKAALNFALRMIRLYFFQFTNQIFWDVDAFLLFKRPHQKLSCLPLLYFILAVFVDSFEIEISMIVVDDKSIFLNFITQIPLTNHVSDIIYHGLLKYMTCYFAFRQKIIFQEKCIRISVTLFHEQRESQRNYVLSTI